MLMLWHADVGLWLYCSHAICIVFRIHVRFPCCVMLYVLHCVGLPLCELVLFRGAMIMPCVVCCCRGFECG